MRYELIFTWVFVGVCSIGLGDEAAKLSPQENLVAAAKHLKAAGFDKKATEIRCLAKILKLELRTKELVATIGSAREALTARSANMEPSIDAETVLSDALSTVQLLQRTLERLSVDEDVETHSVTRNPRSPRAAAALNREQQKESPLMMMVTPRGPIIAEEEEERILGELLP